MAKADEILPTVSLLVDVARPYWYKANRSREAILFDYRTLGDPLWLRFNGGAEAPVGTTALWPTCSPKHCPDDCRTGSCGLWRLSRFELPNGSSAAAVVTHLDACLSPVARLPLQSSSASRSTAGAAGFLILSQ
jgi:hypothetical protein